ncbi:MAG: hypothetical protein ACRDHF_02550 [Tepidiformaceae bacterium]
MVDAGVEFIVIGGVAAAVHGSSRSTADLDVVYRRTTENLQRLSDALGPHQVYLRGAPPGLPFRFDERTIRNGLNFTLISDLGDIDLLGDISGGGGYDDLLPHSVQVEVFGRQCLCLTLDALIRAKRAAGRVKDLEAIAELEAIRDASSL